jgi:hypothetical protein
MKTKKLKRLIDLVTAVAVLIGLIFVGLELRQNTTAIEAASMQNQTDASTGFLLLVASDVELARIWREASQDRSQLSEIDSTRYFLLSRARWLRMQNAYLQWRRGMLSDEDWSFYNGLVCEAGGVEYMDGEIRFQAGWDAHRFALAESFVDFVEGCWSDSQ